jgi:hypothetical protein
MAGSSARTRLHSHEPFPAPVAPAISRCVALAAAERSFQDGDSGRDPEFIGYFNEAELAAELGHCFRDLGDSSRAAGHAARASEQSDGEYPRVTSSPRWSSPMPAPARTILSRRARLRSAR